MPAHDMIGRRWEVEDLGSRNGTSLDGERVSGWRASMAPRVLRLGGSVLLPAPDLEPLRAGVSTAGDTVLGPRMVPVWEAIGRAARFGGTLHVSGESGTGKEHAARAFHALGPRRGGPYPFGFYSLRSTPSSDGGRYKRTSAVPPRPAETSSPVQGTR